MAWDDFGFDSPASDFGSFDAYSGGSYSPQDYNMGQAYQPDVLGSQGQYGGGYNAGTGFQSNPQAPFDPTQQQSMGGGGNWLTNMLPMAGAGAGGSAATGAGANQQGGLMGMLPGLLGIGGSLASIGGQLAGGGQGVTRSPHMGTAATAQMNQSNQAMQPGATGQLPMQQMQMSLLQALQSGQGLPPGYQQLIEQAYQPQMGDLYTQAAEQGRKRGFFDAPATSPPGGAILGPGLANLQGQMAQSKLGLMQSLPQTFNQPIATQIGAAGQQGQGLLRAAQLGTGETASAPIGQTIGQQVGAGLQGVGQALGMKQNMASTGVALAKGGIVTKPTHALIGEAGPEAVIPLGHGGPPMTGPGMPPQGPPGGQAPPPGLIQLLLSLLLHQQASRAAGPGHIMPGGQNMGIASQFPQVQR